MVHLDVVNHNHQDLKLETLEVWYHRKMVLVLVYLVFLPVLVLLVIVFFIYLGKLWIMFLSMVLNLAIVDNV